nr:VTT domain-containing protein [uncultured Hyphomonas sp.]
MTETQTKSAAPLWRRLWPVYVIAGGLLAGWSIGLFDYLSIDALQDNQAALQDFVASHILAAFAIYIAVYALATLFMVPGALWLTIAGGLLFGLTGGTLATVAGATLGASLLFLAARTAFGNMLRERAGPFLRKMEAGFQESPRAYMFALRLLPIVPFPVANIGPALLGARYPDYALTTAIGIIPGVLAYTWIGSGLGATFAEGDINAAAGNLFPAFAALGVVSLIPLVWKKITGRKVPKIESPPA